MNKKRVRYSDIGQPTVGWSVCLIAIDHPTAPNGEWIHTSRVTGIGRTKSGPIVETNNTVYVPGFVEPDDSIGISKGVSNAQPA